MSSVVKLTPELLRKIVLEEKEKYEKDVKAAAKNTREVEADEYADTLEKKIDHLAALKIKESNLRRELAAVVEQRVTIMKALKESASKDKPKSKK
jgi:hypothetical protein